MPWVRIDQNALEHPKIILLGDGPFRLWVTGLAHCQKFLTDGFMNELAVKSFRAYSPKRKDELVRAGLWTVSDGGITVHDYLQWNDSREHVLSAKESALQRLKKHRSQRVSNTSRNGVRNAHALVYGVYGVSLQEKGSGKTIDPDSPSTVPLDLAERAGAFCNETYPQLYAKHRNGARYLGKPAIDFPEAVLLCQTWDDDRLGKIATVFLTTDHEFAEKGSRSIGQFRSMASWCDSKLREAGL